jgi:hypothetical protein
MGTLVTDFTGTATIDAAVIITLGTQIGFNTVKT